MKSNDRKRLTEFLKELNISKNTVPVIEQYLKEHNIKYSDYLREIQTRNPDELTDGNLMDIAISFYEGDLYQSEEKRILLKMYESELEIRDRYRNSADSQEEERELEANRKHYTETLQNLRKKYYKNENNED